MGKITGEMRPDAPDAKEEMQRDIRTTEAEITETLNSIEAKLSPSHLKKEAKEKLLHGTAAVIVKLGYAIKRKPASAAALGVGAAWLMSRRAKKRHKLPAAAMAEVAVEAMPREMKKHPVKTTKRYITLGRVAFAFVSTASAVLLRGKRAQQSLHPGYRHEFPHHRVGGY